MPARNPISRRRRRHRHGPRGGRTEWTLGQRHPRRGRPGIADRAFRRGPPLSVRNDRLLVAGADGVGTKLKLASVLGDAHARVGADLVNHCANVILALGAHPLFFLDDVAMGRLDPTTLEALVGGMALACRENGPALIGGETAEMPGHSADGEYHAAGFIVGEVVPEAAIDGAADRSGDALIGPPSLGLHPNWYVRRGASWPAPTTARPTADCSRPRSRAGKGRRSVTR